MPTSQIVYLDYIENGLAVLHLGSPKEAEFAFSVERLTSLYEAIQDVKKNKPRALVIAGAHEEMFSKGWEPSVLEGLIDERHAKQFSLDGQELCGELESLPCLSVSAISGPCLGIACELALACRIRLISDHPSSLIGLTHVRQGLIPCFGGVQRLTRLAGPSKATDLILRGRTVYPSEALECGLVHEIVPNAKLMTRAETLALRKARPGIPAKPPIKERLIASTKGGRKKLAKAAFESVPSDLRKFYPALDAAASVMLKGMEQGKLAGMAEEAAQFSKLAVSQECKALSHLSALAEKAEALGSMARKHVERLNAVVIGAGRMGSSIAALLAHHGCQVILKDTTEDALKAGQTMIRSYINGLTHLNEKEKSYILNRIETTTHDIPNTSNTNLAIEAIYDDLSVKKKLLLELSRTLPHEAIVASSTSSFSIEQLSQDLQTPERVIGLHFFNGTGRTPLVEIARAKNTGDRAIAIAASLAIKLKKVPVIVEDVPGFLVNRVLYAGLSEILQALKEGVRPEDIEKELTAFGMPIGPLKLMDEIGLDIVARVLPRLEPAGPELELKVSVLKALIDRGRKGRKTNVGFYNYSQQPIQLASDLQALISPKAGKTAKERKAPSLTDRYLIRMLNESVSCLDKGVAGKPGREAADQIDLASVLGMAFPPFRGGILYHGDSIGPKKALEKCRELENALGSRFAPSEGIIRRAENEAPFRA